MPCRVEDDGYSHVLAEACRVGYDAINYGIYPSLPSEIRRAFVRHVGLERNSDGDYQEIEQNVSQVRALIRKFDKFLNSRKRGSGNVVEMITLMDNLKATPNWFNKILKNLKDDYSYEYDLNRFTPRIVAKIAQAERIVKDKKNLYSKMLGRGDTSSEFYLNLGKVVKTVENAEHAIKVMREVVAKSDFIDYYDLEKLFESYGVSTYVNELIPNLVENADVTENMVGKLRNQVKEVMGE